MLPVFRQIATRQKVFSSCFRRRLCTPPPAKPKPLPAVAEQKTTEAGDGIRSLQTSTVFRAVNFELYAKPNRFMIVFGLVTFTSCIIYIGVMVYNGEKQKKVYIAMDDNDELVAREKKSRWT